MKNLKNELKKYGVFIGDNIDPFTKNETLEPLLTKHQKELNANNITFENDINGYKHARYFLCNNLFLLIENVELFIVKLNLGNGDDSFPSITFVGCSTHLSKTEEYFYLSHKQAVNPREQLIKHVSKHSDIYKNVSPEWNLKRLFIQEVPENELIDTLMSQREQLLEEFNNRYNLNELFEVIASEFKQTLAKMHDSYKYFVIA